MVVGPAIAQTNGPDKPVAVIAPYAAGGDTDVALRTLTERLAARLGKPLLVENRSGAGGTIVITATACSAPDG